MESILILKQVLADYRLTNCPKHVEFYSKNKFEKLVHLVGFIISIYNLWTNELSETCRILFQKLI